MGPVTQRPGDEYLDDTERWARDFLESYLGPLRVIDRSRKGGPPGQHDFEADLPNGSVAAIEVTSEVQSDRLAVESEIRRRGLSRFPLAGLTSLWVVNLADEADVRAASRAGNLQPLLSGLEARGLRYANDRGDYRDPVVQELRKLGIVSVYMLAAVGQSGVIMSTGASGGFGWDGPRIDAWLSDFLASDTGGKKLRKLARTKGRAAELHLAIVLSLFSRPGIGVWLTLTARRERGAADYGIPSIEPPHPLTHLWLLPVMATREGFHWARGTGWRTASPGPVIRDNRSLPLITGLRASADANCCLLSSPSGLVLFPAT